MPRGNSGALFFSAMDWGVSEMKRVAGAVLGLRHSRSTDARRLSLSRIEPLSECEARRIPDQDFVAARFDTDADAKRSPSRIVVLLSTPRSGSTYLCELLHCAGFCTAHEYFQPEQYLRLLAHRWGCVDQGRLSWPRYAHALENHRTSSKGVLGINVHGKHLHRFDEALPHFRAAHVDYLWLKRRDKLRQAVSLAIAKQTGQWSSLFKQRAEARYDRSLIQQSLRTIHADEDLIAAYLHAREISYDTIYYEDIVRDSGSALQSVFGIDVSEIARHGVMRRQGGSTNNAWVTSLGKDIFFGRRTDQEGVSLQPAAPCPVTAIRPTRVKRRTSSDSTRKVLIITSAPTHPSNRGNRARINSLVDSLRALGHDVHLMHACRHQEAAVATREAWGKRYVPVVSKRGRPKTLVQRAARKIGSEAGYRYGLDQWYDPAIDDAIDALRDRESFDTVIVEYVFLSRALLRFGDDVLKILDTHDVFANRHRLFLDHQETPAWYSCTPRSEAKGLNRSDVVLAIQEEEAEYFRSRTSSQVVTIGHPVPLNPLSYDDAVPGRLVVIGSDNPVNVGSIGWFIHKVLPGIRKELPYAELAVAGTVCNKLDATAGVRLLGPLDDLGTAYASARVVINPTRFGTGLKIKSVEALAHGRALVTTPCGAAGLSAGAQSAFMVESDPEAFGKQVIELLVNERLASALGQEAYRFSEQYNRRTQTDIMNLFGGRGPVSSEHSDKVAGLA